MTGISTLREIFWLRDTQLQMERHKTISHKAEGQLRKTAQRKEAET